jgi:predicted amidohydrolase YtcJ
MIYLLVNAVVHTMDHRSPCPQALAVKDGRIVEIGGPTRSSGCARTTTS